MHTNTLKGLLYVVDSIKINTQFLIPPILQCWEWTYTNTHTVFEPEPHAQVVSRSSCTFLHTHIHTQIPRAAMPEKKIYIDFSERGDTWLCQAFRMLLGVWESMQDHAKRASICTCAKAIHYKFKQLSECSANSDIRLDLYSSTTA